MSLVDTFLNIIDGWRSTFTQERVFIRAARQSMGSLCAQGRSTISQAICFAGLDQQDWSGEYRLHSKRDWTEGAIFEPILQTALEMINEDVIAIAYDDTRLRKTGKKIANARWHYDPLSPPFHANLMWGLRYLQASVLIPFYRRDSQAPPRSVPIRFTEVPHVKKPGKSATEENWRRYRVESKTHNLSQGFVSSAREVRQDLDHNGAANKHILLVGDGSFCNQTCFKASLDRTSVIARGRKDAKLCFRDQTSSRQRIYAKAKFTPEEVRQNPSIPWSEAQVFHGGQFRAIRYKVVRNVLWQRGARQKELKLIVVAPTRYRTAKTKKFFYRQPAYLLSTANDDIDDLTLIQSYFDRWQIEVNFRETKTTLGLGQAQVRTQASVRKQPAFLVASYAALLLAGHITYGNRRGSAYRPLPKWRRNAKRPSCLDLVNRLTHEVMHRSDIQTDFKFKIAS